MGAGISLSVTFASRLQIELEKPPRPKSGPASSYLVFEFVGYRWGGGAGGVVHCPGHPFADVSDRNPEQLFELVTLVFDYREPRFEITNLFRGAGLPRGQQLATG